MIDPCKLLIEKQKSCWSEDKANEMEKLGRFRIYFKNWTVLSDALGMGNERLGGI